MAPVTNTSVWMYLAVGAESDVAWNYLDFTPSPDTYDAGRMRYKKMGNHVFIAGSVNVIPGTDIDLCNFPEGYCPTGDMEPHESP